ncbi:hypothetical protein TVAG_402440 [Trichomonas vaginalis G3]|uniref:Uncharacterized protein n=1 Tax=Trichomonas vaginalis (strain ATCC PRA-98 / G3) TaxID=412133 RepID=A2DI00_TRIV3|nr:hypothetical protein TVAGG3_0272030 [Trichomonas vaginalis G3]EAY19989.1 hypothetical protein TVAG_402440 [Trichomonas vaginalis G3]KAI5525940.1 hypothetical protein TVAGG3_0272030 [Trichomonas vaginalis G3]|eukprot:XP_001580975.1 hypothetical protein [Trichomonas vaginalis G3]
MEEVTDNDEIGSLKKQIAANNLSGSLTFLEKALQGFSTRYSNYTKVYRSLNELLSFFNIDNANLELGRGITQVLQVYLQTSIKFCRKIDKYIPSISDEFLMNSPESIIREMRQRFVAVSEEISESTANITNKSAEMFASYVYIHAHHSATNKSKLNTAAFPDINDIQYDVSQIHEEMKHIKSIMCYCYRLVLIGQDKTQDMDNEAFNLISSSLSRVKADLENAEKTFVRHVTSLHHLDMLLNGTLEGRIRTGLSNLQNAGNAQQNDADQQSNEN